MQLKCPFAASITARRADCAKATQVVRRGGSEYDCSDAQAHARCTALFARLKPVGLSVFAVEDDLTQMPHSVLVKIQGGGLAGLQRLAGQSAERIADIDTLITHAVDDAGGVDGIAVDALGADMDAYRLERRSRRKGRI